MGSSQRTASSAGRPRKRRELSFSRLTALREHLGSSLWFTPSLLIAGAILLALVFAAIDREIAETESGERLLLVFSGGPEAARAVLETIASSILTLTALVFSITVLVLQLTSTQYSPRALRTFLRDGVSKVTMGVFLGTFTFALLGIREVRSETADGPSFVPGILVTGAFLLTLLSLYTFLFYIHHVSRRIQASSILASIAEESTHALERLYPDPLSEGTEDGAFEQPEPVQRIVSRTASLITSVDEHELVRLAEEKGVCLIMLAGVGDFIVHDQPLIAVAGGRIDDDDEALQHVRVGYHRTMEQDLRFGFRQMVDVAVRALSPGTNDPSTAVLALDRIHDLLRRLGCRQFPDSVHTDDSGEVRLVMHPQTWESFVRMSVEEIAYYGHDAPQVRHRLHRMYADLMEALPDQRRAAVRKVAEQTGWADL